MNKAYQSIIGILLFFAIFQTTNTWAQESSNSYFSKGVEYSRNGDCKKALQEFTLANKNGMDDPKLHYNIGVCEYKLNHYTEARQAFTKAGNNPKFAWLSTYNIGLVEKASKNPQLAKAYFQKVYEHSTDEKLRSLAGHQLGIESSGSTAPDVKSWHSLVSSSIGYDDNIVDPAQLASSRGDSFISALIYSTKLLNGTPDNGMNIKLSAFATRYKQVNIYNTNMLEAGLGKSFSASTWDNEIALDVTQSTLGGTDYLRTSKLAISSNHRLNDTDVLMLYYGFSNISALTTQNAFLEGVNHKAKATWKTKQDEKELRLSYSLEANNRKNLSTGTTFTSYSPTRHTIEAKGTIPIASKLYLEGRTNYRMSNYSDSNILSTGQVIKRSDSRLMAAIKIKRVISKTFEMNAEYSYTNNTSNISTYNYTRNIFSIGLDMQF